MSPHSRQAFAQASQASAQRPHIVGERADSYCIKDTHVWQVSIQVRQSFSHIAQSQPVTHSRQACRQALHASMQAAFLAGSIAVSAAGAEAAVIEPGHTRAFLQFGEWVTHGDFDRYYPLCNFGVKEISSEVQEIKPDRFVVTRVGQGWDYVVSREQPMMVADLEGWRRIWRQRPRDINWYYRFWLSSPRQPQVMWLTCHGGFGDWPDVDFPTRTEMREALGEKAKLLY